MHLSLREGLLGFSRGIAHLDKREVIVEHLEEEIRVARVVVEATSKELKLPVDEVRRPIRRSQAAAPWQHAPPPRRAPLALATCLAPAAAARPLS